jgi:hypothetical protein
MQSTIDSYGSCLKTAADVATTASTRDPTQTTTTASPPSWMLSDAGVSCASTCPNQACSVSSMNLLTTSNFVNSVLATISGAPTCDSFVGSTAATAPSASHGTCSYATGLTTCSATSSNRRICCCSESGCVIPAAPVTTTTTTVTTTAPPTTTSAAYGWVVGQTAQTCTAACNQGACSTASQNAVTSTTIFNFVSSLIAGAPTCTRFSSSTYAEDPSFYYTGTCYLSSGISSCSASYSNTRRLCCKYFVVRPVFVWLL